MRDEMFDDGLVHSHHWATEKPMISTRSSEPEEPDHDDGLVHEHGWASTGK